MQMHEHTSSGYNHYQNSDVHAFAYDLPKLYFMLGVIEIHSMVPQLNEWSFIFHISIVFDYLAYYIFYFIGILSILLITFFYQGFITLFYLHFKFHKDWTDKLFLLNIYFFSFILCSKRVKAFWKCYNWIKLVKN